MSNQKHIIEAQATLPDGGIVRGPVTTEDNKTFLFVDTVSNQEFKLALERNDLGWHEAANQAPSAHQQMIDEIGVFIDNAIGNNPVTSKIKIE